MKKEENIDVFNNDAKKKAGYLYTSDDLYSARTATKKQTDEVVNMIRRYFPKALNVIDIGCGDGKHTIELFKILSPKSILGIDPAEDAIKIAKEKIKNKRRAHISFLVGNLYEVNKLFKKGQFDLAIIRGVLHHLYNPDYAIRKISMVFPNVIIIEANGYNPILKIIEKVSPYHREHEEKSYWPPLLNSWFRQQGYEIITEEYYGIVPYFCPEPIARFLKLLEPFFENIPLLNKLYCACNYILYRK